MGQGPERTHKTLGSSVCSIDEWSPPSVFIEYLVSTSEESKLNTAIFCCIHTYSYLMLYHNVYTFICTAHPQTHINNTYTCMHTRTYVYLSMYTVGVHHLWSMRLQIPKKNNSKASGTVYLNFMAQQQCLKRSFSKYPDHSSLWLWNTQTNHELHCHSLKKSTAVERDQKETTILNPYRVSL